MPASSPSSASASASAPPASDALEVVKSESDFVAALERHKTRLLVVNYGADWCTHCHKVRDALRGLRRERAYADVAIVDADVDSLPFTARHVRWTPTVGFYRKGRLVDEATRARPTQVLDKIWLHATRDPDDGADDGDTKGPATSVRGRLK